MLHCIICWSFQMRCIQHSSLTVLDCVCSWHSVLCTCSAVENDLRIEMEGEGGPWEGWEGWNSMHSEMPVVLLVVINYVILLDYGNECLKQLLENSSSLCWLALCVLWFLPPGCSCITLSSPSERAIIAKIWAYSWLRKKKELFLPKLIQSLEKHLCLC